MEKRKALPERTLEDGISEIRQLLGKSVDRVLSADNPVVGLEREDFQSFTFRRAGYHTNPDIYPSSDRSLYTLTYNDGRQAFVISGNIDDPSPTAIYEVGSAVTGGIDLRQSMHVVYLYDGAETITEIGPNGETNQYQGDWGRPEALLPEVAKKLGILVNTEKFFRTT
jgi:hypothetical protein